MVLENIDKSLTAVGSKVELNLNLEPWRKLRGLEDTKAWEAPDIEFVCQFIEQADMQGKMLESVDHGDREGTMGYALTVIIAKGKPGVGAKQLEAWLRTQARDGIKKLNDQSHG